MSLQEAFYEEPTEGGCSNCGEYNPVCSKCNKQLNYSDGEFLCNVDDDLHCCVKCKPKRKEVLG